MIVLENRLFSAVSGHLPFTVLMHAYHLRSSKNLAQLWKPRQTLAANLGKLNVVCA